MRYGCKSEIPLLTQAQQNWPFGCSCSTSIPVRQSTMSCLLLLTPRQGRANGSQAGNTDFGTLVSPSVDSHPINLLMCSSREYRGNYGTSCDGCRHSVWHPKSGLGFPLFQRFLNFLQCDAWIILVGSSAATVTTLVFFYVLWEFPMFLKHVKSEGADPNVVVQLHTFYQLNVSLA